MSTNLSFRLSYDEIIYLGAALTSQKEIYGLKAKKSAPNENNEQKWRNVRDSLVEKQFITGTGNDVTVNPILATMIQIVCNPRLFLIVQSKASESVVTQNYYITRRAAVKMEEEKLADDYYYLSRFDDSDHLYEDLAATYQFDEEAFVYSPNRITLSLEQFESYMKTVNGGTAEESYNQLFDLGFPKECIDDFYYALKTKNHFLTIVTLSFDPSLDEKQNVASEILVFGGKKSLWQLELDRKAYIYGTNKSILSKKLEVISELFKYF